jgi:hypothetical protein
VLLEEANFLVPGHPILAYSVDKVVGVQLAPGIQHAGAREFGGDHEIRYPLDLGLASVNLGEDGTTVCGALQQFSCVIDDFVLVCSAVGD